LSVFLLIILITFSLSNLLIPRPRVIDYVGELQSAELIHLARFYWEYNNNRSFDELLKIFYIYNEKIKANVPKVAYTLKRKIVCERDGLGLYETVFNNSVIFRSSWRWNFSNIYIGYENNEAVIFKNYTLVYYHEYIAPQWGKIVLYPEIYTTCNVKIKRVYDTWIIGIPLEMSRVDFYDKFGIKIFICDRE